LIAVGDKVLGSALADERMKVTELDRLNIRVLADRLRLASEQGLLAG